MHRLPWIKNRFKGEHVLLDGGFAIELSKREVDLNHPLWTAKALLETPDKVYQAHRAYVAAGAQIISTGSYQATPQRFEELGLSANDITQLFNDSVALARKATKSSDALVAASIGPYGAYLADGSEYTGAYNLSKQALIDFHRIKWQRLHQAAPDFFAVETVPNVNEVKAIAELAKAFDKQLIWVSLSCKNAHHLADGTPLAEVLPIIRDLPNVVAIGANCFDPSFSQQLGEHIQKHSDKPLIIYPNKGEKYDPESKTWVTRDDDAFTSQVMSLCKNRQLLVGGCCQIDSDAIRQLRDNLSQ